MSDRTDGLKLYVDDVRRCPDGWHVARTVTEAVRILATVPVEVVSLDHDIAHEAPGRAVYFSCPETFEPVARYIALMPKRPEVRFHTANPDGQKKMEAILAPPQERTGRFGQCLICGWNPCAKDALDAAQAAHAAQGGL